MISPKSPISPEERAADIWRRIEDAADFFAIATIAQAIRQAENDALQGRGGMREPNRISYVPSVADAPRESSMASEAGRQVAPPESLTVYLNGRFVEISGLALEVARAMWGTESLVAKEAFERGFQGGLERAAKCAEGGDFLHYNAPDAVFGRSVASAIRRLKSPPAQHGDGPQT